MRHTPFLLFAVLLAFPPALPAQPMTKEEREEMEFMAAQMEAEAKTGMGLAMRGKYQEAIAQLNKEIAAGQNVANAYFWRADCWRKADKSVDADKAIADYTKAIETKP